MTELKKNEGIAVAVAVIVAVTSISAVMFSNSGFASVFSGVTNISGANYTVDEKEINTEAISDFEAKDIVVGSGKRVAIGDTIVVHYVGQLENGTTFDTSVTNSIPFVTKIGVGEVITGWDIGILDMQEGGTRRLVIPAELGYGSREIKDVEGNVIIPKNSTLIFDIVLLQVEKNI